MNKLELIARALLSDLSDESKSPEEKRTIIAESLKSYGAEVVNLGIYLTQKQLEPDMIREIMEPHGLEFDGKKKRFF